MYNIKLQYIYLRQRNRVELYYTYVVRAHVGSCHYLMSIKIVECSGLDPTTRLRVWLASPLPFFSFFIPSLISLVALSLSPSHLS